MWKSYRAASLRAVSSQRRRTALRYRSVPHPARTATPLTGTATYRPTPSIPER